MSRSQPSLRDRRVVRLVTSPARVEPTQEARASLAIVPAKPLGHPARNAAEQRHLRPPSETMLAMEGGFVSLQRELLHRLRADLEPRGGSVAHARQLVDQLLELTAGDAIGRPLLLKQRTATVLKVLLASPGRAHSADDLARLAGIRRRSPQAVRVHICNLRAELALHGVNNAVESVWGEGYRITQPRATEVCRLLRGRAV